MTLPAQPHRTLPYTIKKGSTGWAVFALQQAVADAGHPTTADGDFGTLTERSVKAFQKGAGLTADGVAGPITQQSLLTVVDRIVATRVPAVPRGVMRGFFAGEGANILAAVNWGVSGGVDCGCVQKRVYGPPFDSKALRHAFDPLVTAEAAARALAGQIKAYANPHPACPFTSLQLGVLHHNWPYAASQYHRYGKLPNPGKTATWAPRPMTYAEWCRFYITSILRFVK